MKNNDQSHQVEGNLDDYYTNNIKCTHKHKINDTNKVKHYTHHQDATYAYYNYTTESIYYGFILLNYSLHSFI